MEDIADMSHLVKKPPKKKGKVGKAGDDVPEPEGRQHRDRVKMRHFLSGQDICFSLRWFLRVSL